jgi:indolepyruvate ferredoxin oxidoreductase beta subunit
MRLNCLLTGVGGQGTVLLSRLIGEAALERGLDVRGAETIGMAQRGGSVVSHIRIGEGIYSPLISPGGADRIIAFEPAEALRVLPYLAAAGRMILLDRAVPPAASSPAAYDARAMTAHLAAALGTGDPGGRLRIIPGDELLQSCGSPRVLNVALFGAALELGFFPFNREEALRVLGRRISGRFLAPNLRAFDLGAALVR